MLSSRIELEEEIKSILLSKKPNFETVLSLLRDNLTLITYNLGKYILETLKTQELLFIRQSAEESPYSAYAHDVLKIIQKSTIAPHYQLYLNTLAISIIALSNETSHETILKLYNESKQLGVDDMRDFYPRVLNALSRSRKQNYNSAYPLENPLIIFEEAREKNDPRLRACYIQILDIIAQSNLNPQEREKYDAKANQFLTEAIAKEASPSEGFKSLHCIPDHLSDTFKSLPLSCKKDKQTRLVDLHGRSPGVAYYTLKELLLTQSTEKLVIIYGKGMHSLTRMKEEKPLKESVLKLITDLNIAGWNISLKPCIENNGRLEITIKSKPLSSKRVKTSQNTRPSDGVKSITPNFWKQRIEAVREAEVRGKAEAEAAKERAEVEARAKVEAEATKAEIKPPMTNFWDQRIAAAKQKAEAEKKAAAKQKAEAEEKKAADRREDNLRFINNNFAASMLLPRPGISKPLNAGASAYIPPSQRNNMMK